MQPLAPMQSEAARVIAQGAALATFVLLGSMALRAFHPERASA